MAAVPGMVPKKSSPGPGAAGTGGGRDTPQAGRERGIFEKERQGRGTGVDRPPIYKPPTPKQSLSPAGRALKGTSAVHGMLPVL